MNESANIHSTPQMLKNLIFSFLHSDSQRSLKQIFCIDENIRKNLNTFSIEIRAQLCQNKGKILENLILLFL
jgi:hypothetical protein